MSCVCSCMGPMADSTGMISRSTARLFRRDRMTGRSWNSDFRLGLQTSSHGRKIATRAKRRLKLPTQEPHTSDARYW